MTNGGIGWSGTSVGCVASKVAPGRKVQPCSQIGARALNCLCLQASAFGDNYGRLVPGVTFSRFDPNRTLRNHAPREADWGELNKTIEDLMAIYNAHHGA
jgi:hypothetical protein